MKSLSLLQTQSNFQSGTFIKMKTALSTSNNKRSSYKLPQGHIQIQDAVCLPFKRGDGKGPLGCCKGFLPETADESLYQMFSTKHFQWAHSTAQDTLYLKQSILSFLSSGRLSAFLPVKDSQPQTSSFPRYLCVLENFSLCKIADQC